MKAKKNITEEMGTLGALLRLPYLALQKRVYDRLAEMGFADIRAAHSTVFRQILPDGSRVTDMAEAAQITKQSMAYLVDYLYQRGYVEFCPDPDDGRAKLVRLTARGKEFQQAAMHQSVRVESEMADRMAPGEMAELRRLLERLVAVCDVRGSEGG